MLEGEAAEMDSVGRQLRDIYTDDCPQSSLSRMTEPMNRQRHEPPLLIVIDIALPPFLNNHSLVKQKISPISRSVQHSSPHFHHSIFD